MPTIATAKLQPAPASLDAALAPGEAILWRGKPEKLPFVLRTWPLSVFGVLLVVSVAIYEVVVTTTDAPDVLAFWGIPFVIAGLYMLAGHFLVTLREWQNTEYVLTPSRVLIRHGVFQPTLAVYSVLGLPHIEVEMHRRGTGNLMFKPREGQGYGPWPGYQTMWPYTPGYLVGLMYLRDPVAVRDLIESVRKG